MKVNDSVTSNLPELSITNSYTLYWRLHISGYIAIIWETTFNIAQNFTFVCKM